VEDGVGGLERPFFAHNLHERGVVPVHDHGCAVESPFEHVLVVAADRYRLIGCGRRCSNSLWDVRHKVLGLVGAAVFVVVCGSGRLSSRATIVDYAADVVLVVILGACGLRDGSHPEVVSHVSLISCYNDVVSLTHTDADNGSFIRFDGYKIGCNDSHGVVVDHELPMGVDSGVDEANAVRSAGGEGNIVAMTAVSESVGAVDQTVVENWRTIHLGGEVELINRLVVPVVEEEHTQVLVVVCRGRSIDDNAAKDALPSLQGEMRVIPSRPVLGSSPGVSH